MFHQILGLIPSGDLCLMKKILPFLYKHYPEFQYIFWPDLVNAYYSNATVGWMNENLNYVTKEINPPNIPLANRKFLGLFSITRLREWLGIKTTNQLLKRIKTKLKEIDLLTENIYRT